jgi:hypothetical protein
MVEPMEPRSRKSNHFRDLPKKDGTGYGFQFPQNDKRHFENPIISKSFKRDLQNNVAQPSNIEEAYSLLHKGLGLITHELAI